MYHKVVCSIAKCVVGIGAWLGLTCAIFIRHGTHTAPDWWIIPSVAWGILLGLWILVDWWRE
jgi:hypothetical protein